MGDRFRLGILTALWRRPEIAEVVLRHHVALDVPGVEITVSAVRSPEDEDPAPTVPGVLYREAPNHPLSDKWNAGIGALCDLDLDAVMIVGSDDLVSAGYVAEAVEAIQAGAPLVRPLSLVFVDTETGKAHRSALRRIGLGRTLSRSLLERVSYRPWPHGISRRLDGGMDRRLYGLYDRTKEAAVPVGGNLGNGPVELVDLKSAVNMWDYANMLRVRAPGSSDLDGHAYLLEHFPEPYSALMATQTKTKTTTKKATTKKAAPKKPVAKKAKADPKVKAVVALKNLQGDWTGLGKRVFRGAKFEVPNAIADRLIRQKLARKA